MLDIHNLERRWLKYKIKSYLPHIIALFIAALLLVTLTFTWSNTEDAPASAQLRKSSLKLSPMPEINTTSSNEETSTILEPSMNFIQSFQEPQTITPIQNVSVHTKIEKPIHETIASPKVLNIPDSTPIKPPTNVVTSSPSKSLSMNRNDSKLDIESIERRFKETSNPNLGLFIARYHYDHGNYSDAYNFSLKINTLNSKIDESWIIFSKSLVKLGKVDQAKKTLQLYISESNSESARSLLDSIERGNFK